MKALAFGFTSNSFSGHVDPFEPSWSSACRATYTDELTVRPAWLMARVMARVLISDADGCRSRWGNGAQFVCMATFFAFRAGDGNRTRTVSLGTNLIWRIRCVRQDDRARRGHRVRPRLAATSRTLGHAEGTEWARVIRRADSYWKVLGSIPVGGSRCLRWLGLRSRAWSSTPGDRQPGCRR